MTTETVETDRDPTDAEQVRAIYARYAFAYDQGRADDFAALFTDTGAFEIAGGAVVSGRAALAGMVTAAAARSGDTMHVVSNVLVSVAGDSATGRAYVVLLAMDEGALRIVTAGTYEDSFDRTADGWLLSRRRFEPVVGPNPLGVPIGPQDDSCSPRRT